MELIRKGKVREVYADGEDVILVASDRVSVYDVVLPTPIPDKGAILTQLSLWWFRLLEDLVPNHVVSEDVPPEWKGRAIRCRRLDNLRVCAWRREPIGLLACHDFAPTSPTPWRSSTRASKARKHRAAQTPGPVEVVYR